MGNEFFYVLAIVILGIIAFGYFIKADDEEELKKMYQKAYNGSVNEINHLLDIIANTQSQLAKEIEEHNENIKYYEALLHMQKEVCDERLREAGYEMDDEDEEEY